MDKSISVSKRNRLLSDVTDRTTWSQSCVHCGRVMQIREFGQNRSGGWYTMCLLCRETREVRELYERQQESIAAGIEELAKAAATKRTPLPDMARICADLVDALGGQEEFVEKWADSIKKTKKGSKTSLDAYGAVAKAINATAAQQTRELEMGMRSQKEIEKAIEKMVMQKLMQKLGLVDEPDSKANGQRQLTHADPA